MEESNWNLALGYVSRRETSCGALRQYLTRKKMPVAEIDEILERLLRLGYVDDLRYARLAVRDALRTKKGIHRVRSRLHMKGVRLSEEELVALWQEEKENLRENPLKDAFEVAVKKWGWEEGTSIDRKTVVKVMQYLLRRGFVYSEINEMIESWRRNRV